MSTMFANLFGTKQEAPATPANSANAIDPATNQMPANKDSDSGKSPMDSYQDLWQNTGNDKGAPAKTFNLDKLPELVSQMDFTKSVTPEQLQQISAGGQEAMTAFAQVLGAVSRDTYAQSTATTASMVEAAVAKARQEFEASLPSAVRQAQAVDTVKQQNPLVNDPAFSPVVSAVTSQFLKRFPEATPADINNHINGYFDMMASKVNGAKVDPNAPKETDWSQFFS